MNILIIAGMSDKKLTSKLKPIVNSDFVEKIYLVRRYPLLLSQKIICYYPPKILRINTVTSELYRLAVIIYLCIFKRVDVIMGMYLILHGIFAGITGKLLKKTIIQNLLGSDLHKALKNNVLFKFIQKADIVITRGANTKETLINKGIDENKIFCIPNLFNFDKIPLVSNRKTFIYDLIYLGNLVKVKRIDILLNALNILKHNYNYKDIKIALIGEGRLKKSLINMAKDLDLNDNVHFLGYQKNIYSFLNKSKIFIMTSEYEGLPMAMIEALSYGLPCIMPDVSNITTVAVHNYNSLLASVGDIEGFTEQIDKLLTDENLYKKLSKNAIKIKEEKAYEYSLEHITNIWNEIFKKISKHSR